MAGPKAPRTRRDYEAVLEHIVSELGHAELTGFKRLHRIAEMEANANRTRFANYIQQVMSVLFEHAIDIGGRSTTLRRPCAS
jgi:serine acetyltransferase